MVERKKKPVNRKSPFPLPPPLLLPAQKKINWVLYVMKNGEESSNWKRVPKSTITTPRKNNLTLTTKKNYQKACFALTLLSDNIYSKDIAHIYQSVVSVEFIHGMDMLSHHGCEGYKEKNGWEG